MRISFDPNKAEANYCNNPGAEIRLISPWKATAKERECYKTEYVYSNAWRGPVAPQIGKTRITICLDDAVLEVLWFHIRSEAAGKVYQTFINNALNEYLSKDSGGLEETLRRIVCEEPGWAA